MSGSFEQAVIDKMRVDTRRNSPQNVNVISHINNLMYKNKDGKFLNTDADKEKLFAELYEKLETTLNGEEILYHTGRNLLYFTVFLSDDYLDLVEICLETIYKNTPTINFDVLFITDEVFKLKILQRNVTSKFTCHFLIKPAQFTGFWASAKKLSVYDFPEINNYEKILFLDCDIICIKDLNDVFNLNTDSGFLYTAKNPTVSSNAIMVATHGLMYLTERDASFIHNNPDKILPFNAGQFLFLNSKKMKGHFDNVRWLMNSWPDTYFFEQAPMNHYFVLNGLVKKLEAHGEDLVSFAVVKTWNKMPNSKKPTQFIQPKLVVRGSTSSHFEEIKESETTEISKPTMFRLNKSTVLCHFINNASTTGGKKKQSIQEYINANKL